MWCGWLFGGLGCVISALVYCCFRSGLFACFKRLVLWDAGTYGLCVLRFRLCDLFLVPGSMIVCRLFINSVVFVH